MSGIYLGMKIASDKGLTSADVLSHNNLLKFIIKPSKLKNIIISILLIQAVNCNSSLSSTLNLNIPLKQKKNEPGAGTCL